MEYYIDIERKKRNTAGAKAPSDINELCKRWGMTRFRMPMFPKEKNKLYQKVWLLIYAMLYWRRLAAILKDGDIVVYQHPMYGNRVAKKYITKIKKKVDCTFIALIHDLESLRKGIERVSRVNPKTNQLADNVLLKRFDKVICHNERMKDYLINNGFVESKLVTLEIFDYLTECSPSVTKMSEKPTIAIAGYLAKGKCKYIYDIFNHSGLQYNDKLLVHLYGIDYEEKEVNNNMNYHGSFSPEELPGVIEGDFGLVWDGTSTKTCTGNTGEYLKYNNPHKTSLYLASGMPVIVWKQAAIADFVIRNNVGIVVDNLENLDQVISNIKTEEYKKKRENAVIVGRKIRDGYYFKQALLACLNDD